MKKTYSKPQIVFDDFELSTSIAGSCGVISNFSQMQCGVGDDVFMVFTEDVTTCNVRQVDGYRGMCYHVPEAGMQVFSS